MYCGKCGSEIDKKTGLCPNCDAAALEKVQEVTTKKSLKKAKRRGVTAIIALILVIAIVVSSVVFAFSKGWIGNNSEEEKKKVQTTYVTYLNKTIIPEIGEYDSDHPESSNEGVHSALFCDLNNDDKEEFVVAYSKENGNNIEFNISCYEYDEDTKNPEKAEENVELIGTVTPSTEPDYTENDEDEFHLSNQTIVYSIVYNDRTYIVYEHLSWVNDFNYECYVYTVENGKFIEVSNVFRSVSEETGAELVYSQRRPNGMFDGDDYTLTDFDFANHQKIITEIINQDLGTTTTTLDIFYYDYYGNDKPAYKFDKYFKSSDEAICKFFECFDIIKPQGGYVLNNYSLLNDSGTGPLYRINFDNDLNLIYSYLYYWYYDEKGNIVEKYEINDYTDWKSLIGNDDSEQAAETDKIDIEKMISDAGIFAWNWFYDNTHTDKSKTITKHITADWGDSDFVFEPITEKSIKSKNDLIELTNKYFTSSITEELLNCKQWYEENNQLYVSTTDGLGDPLVDTYDVYVEKESDSKYNLKIIGYMNNEIVDYPHDVTLELINDNWVLNEIFAFYSAPKINVINENSKDYKKYQQYFCYLDKLLNDCSNSNNYSLYDVDKNGVLELIIDKHDNEAEAKFEFYTYDSGIVDLGDVPAGYSALLIPNDKEKGLYRACSRADYYNLMLLNINYNAIKIENIEEGPEENYSQSKTEKYFSECEPVEWFQLGYEYSDTLDPVIYENLRIALK